MILAKIFFERGQTTQALETLYSLNENFQSYPYWVGKSYITIGEIFIYENDNFQAEATLLSIVENTSIEEIKNEKIIEVKKYDMVRRSISENNKVPMQIHAYEYE